MTLHKLCSAAVALTLGAAICPSGVSAAALAGGPSAVKTQSWSLAEGRLKLRTPPPDAMVLIPFVQALVDYDAAVHAGGRSAPEARQIEVDIRLMAPGVKQELAGFAERLRQNGEVEAFNQLAVARAKRSPNSELVLAGIKSAGGAYNGLVHIGPQIDGLLPADHMALLDILGGVNQLVGAPAANAAIGETACGFVFWVFTLGYGQGVAYHYCYR